MIDIFSAAYFQRKFEVYPADTPTDAVISTSAHFELLRRIYPSAIIYYSATPVWMQKNGFFIETIGKDMKDKDLMLMDRDLYKKIFGKREKVKDSFLILRNIELIERLGLGRYDYR